MPPPTHPDSLAEELKRLHLQCYVWRNALKQLLSSLKLCFNDGKGEKIILGY